MAGQQSERDAPVTGGTIQGAPKQGSAMASVRWTAAGNLLRTVLATGQLLIIARLVSVAEFGLVVLVSSMVLIAQQISDAGLSSALIRFRDATEDEKSSLFWLNAAIGVVIAAIIFLIAPAIAAAFKAPTLAGMLRIASTIFIAQGLFLQLRVLAERDMRFGDVIRVELAATAVGFVVAIILALMGQGAPSVVWGQTASAFTQLGLSWLVLTRDWKPRFHFKAREVARFVPYGLDILLVNIATSLTVQLDILIAGLFFQKQVFGSFAQPRDLSLKVMTAINPVVTRVGLPLIAQHQDNPQQAGKIYLRVIRMSASVCFPVYAGMALLAGDILPVVLGKQWTHAAALMPYIAPWFAFRCVVNPLGSYMYAMGRSRHALYYQIGFAAVVALASYIGAQFGPITLALAMLATYFVFSEICWATVLRPISGVSFMAYHRQIYLPLACTLLAAGAVLAARMLLGPGLLPLAAAVAVGGFVFIAVSFFLNSAGVDEVRKLVGLRARPAIG
ncbi:MAG TPA: lipopolysaccharide biosynthesis protein [Sphingobium sp.]|uniref:lipopolysaccharide biosynthesis protein n=1 Tax=Sphingobium sp. TaxID=1912891 RepID=UPI002ECFEA18